MFIGGLTWLVLVVHTVPVKAMDLSFVDCYSDLTLNQIHSRKTKAELKVELKRMILTF